MKFVDGRPRIEWHNTLPEQKDVIQKVVSYLRRGLKKRLDAEAICRICGINASDHNKKAIRRLMRIAPQVKLISVDEKKESFVYVLNEEGKAGRAA